MPQLSGTSRRILVSTVLISDLIMVHNFHEVTIGNKIKNRQHRKHGQTVKKKTKNKMLIKTIQLNVLHP